LKRKALSGIILTLLLTSIFTLALNIEPAKATDTIYIRADGSIDPPTAPISTVDSITYTFTGNVYDSIVVERNNIAIDGSGYTLQGSGIGSGIINPYHDAMNVTIKNANIKGFRIGVESWYGFVLLKNNIVYNSGYGVWGAGLISQNIISNNGYEGIMIPEGGSSTISGNTLVNNGINARGLANIIGNNINDGTIWVREGGGSSILGNNVSNGGIVLQERWSDTVSGNNMTDFSTGIFLWGATNCIIFRNSVTNCDCGVRVGTYTDSNAISENNIAVCGDGIRLGGDLCRNNTITRNIIANNGYGIFFNGGLSSPNNTRTYHNNFIYNAEQVGHETAPPQGSLNFWDDGYPSGGNHWSDYIGVDLKRGPDQDFLGSDGIGDTPYVIGVGNQDHYPLMNPWTPTPHTITATIDIGPDTLNMKSQVRWITAYIQLPERYNPEDIDASTILFNGTVPPVLDPKYGFVTNSSEYLVDQNNDGILERMVKFDRVKLELWIYQSVGMQYDVSLTITGKLSDGTSFDGTDTISVFWAGQRSPSKR
jgi:parallel beta-helix repeat protein